jgi:hypothetical protein
MTDNVQKHNICVYFVVHHSLYYAYERLLRIIMKLDANFTNMGAILREAKGKLKGP